MLSLHKEAAPPNTAVEPGGTVKLRQLEAMRAIMARGTTTHAADALGLTQSTVSRLISQLEEELGLNIFDRRHGRLLITPEGRQFFSVAEKVLSGIDQITATARDIRTLRTGALRIIAMPALAFGLLPVPIARLNACHEKVKVAIDTGTREELEEGVASGQYDLGLATLPIDRDGIESENLANIDSVCIAPAGHPFAAKKKVTAQDMEGLNFVSISPGTFLRYRIDEKFSEMGVRRVLNVEAPSTIMVCSLVASGAGVSIVHPFMAHAFGDTVVTRPFEPSVRFEYGIVYPAGQTRSQITRTFVEMLREFVAPYGA